MTACAQAGLTAFLLLFLVPAVAMTQDGAPIDQTQNQSSLAQLQQTNPGFLVRVSLDRTSRDYREGDSLAATVVSEVDAFVYVLYEQADGQTFQIFPNNKQPENRVKARQAIRIPGDNDLFRWKIGPPFGREILKVVATERPVKVLEQPSLRSKRFNTISTAQVKAVTLEVGADRADPANDNEPQPINPGRWAEAEVELTTYPANRELQVAGGKRYGVFFGVSQHKFSTFEETTTGRNPNLSTPHRDARQLNTVLKDIGQMNETQVFTNELATRENLERSITQWLPSVSRPGDTIVIYYSGHGGQVPDDGTDENDQLDEFLVPHDFVGLAALAGILKQSEEGTLPAEYIPYVSLGKQAFDQAGSLEKAEEVLIRQTGVSDDQFGHWLQKLDGRQVIVILDICHSGGFATQEKDLKAKPALRSATFDFLDREAGRLKDLGQDGSVLLTASATQEVSLVRLEDDLSVMTYYLIDVLEKATGPLEIGDAYQQCSNGVESYFESDLVREINARRAAKGLEPLTPHHPQLYNLARKPVYLKP